MLRPSRALAQAALLVACAGVVGAGCGADVENDGPEAARAVVERYGRAFADRDARLICKELFATRLIRQVESVGLPCDVALAEATKAVTDPRITVGEVTVIGEQAFVETHSTARGQKASDDRMELVREDDRWKIAALATDDAGGTATTPGATSSTATVGPQVTITPPTTGADRTATAGPPVTITPGERTTDSTR